MSGESNGHTDPQAPTHFVTGGFFIRINLRPPIIALSAFVCQNSNFTYKPSNKLNPNFIKPISPAMLDNNKRRHLPYRSCPYRLAYHPIYDFYQRSSQAQSSHHHHTHTRFLMLIKGMNIEPTSLLKEAPF